MSAFRYRTGQKTAQVKKFQTLCDFIGDYLQTRGTISSYDANKLRQFKSQQSRLNKLLDHLGNSQDADIYDDLRGALESDPSNTWFLEHLDRMDVVGSPDEEAAGIQRQQQDVMGRVDAQEDDVEDAVNKLSRTLRRVNPGGRISKTGAPEELRTQCVETSSESNDSNEVLKMKFQRLHKDLVAVDLSPILPDLFAEFVINAEQMDKLQSIDDTKQRTQHLLTMLHTSKHQETFVHLRRAMTDDHTLRGLVGKLDGVQVPGSAPVSNSQQPVLLSDEQAPALPPRRSVKEPASLGVKATAIRNYKASESDELSLNVGDFVEVLKQGSTDWWFGRKADGKTGTFPARNVKVSQDVGEATKDFSSLTVNQLACLPDGMHVAGIAFLGDKVYQILAKTNRIEVYCATGFNLLRHITIAELFKPSDMAASPTRNCLFIADSIDDTSTNTRIFRVDPFSGKATLKWVVDDKAECISVSAAATVLATCHAVGKINEYTVDGQLARTVKLHAELTNPWHSILLPSGEFIVSHGTDDEAVHRVCKVCATDSSPPILKFGEGMEKLRVPLQLAIHSRGLVFVTDTFNQRVAVLKSSSLQFVRYITFATDDNMNITASDEHGLFPSNVCVDEMRGRLLVSWNTFNPESANINSVKVYKIELV